MRTLLVLRRIGLLAVGLLRLHLLLALLHLLQNLLRRARHLAGREGRARGSGDGGELLRLRRRRRLRLLVGLCVVVGCAGLNAPCGRLRGSRLAGAEQNLPRRSLALIADHEHVIAGALQELGEHIARLAGAVVSKNPLIGSQPIYLCAGNGGNILQNLLEA
jgi:hypothetical protein